MGNSEMKNSKIKYNILSIFIYIVGIILLVQLFNLQIVKGQEYRNQSNTRLTRESVLQAARGNILDRTGNAIVSNSMGFRLDLYNEFFINRRVEKKLFDREELQLLKAE